MQAAILLMLGLLSMICGGCSEGSDAVDSSIVQLKLPSMEPIEGDGGGTSVFVAVHCEPGGDPSSTGYVSLHWPALVELVASADRHDVRLTLLMNPQWATFALEDPSRLELVRQWESNGHELGLHSHGPHMGNWNGYTDQEEYFSSPDFLGTTDDMMAVVNRLPVSGRMETACVTVEDQDYDFPAGLSYATNGGGDKLEDLWSTPVECTWHGHRVLGVTHARYAGAFNEVNIDLQQLRSLLDEEGDGQVMGLVFHCFEYAEDPDPFDALFALVDEERIHVETVASIMKRYE